MRFAATALMLALSGCNAPPQAIKVEQAQVRLPAVKGNPGAAYFALRGGPVDERLLSVSSPLAVRAEMHDMEMSGGVMKMAEMKSGVAVPAGDLVEFRSGGKHVMLFNISRRVEPGSKMPLTLTFASGTVLSTEAIAIAAGDSGHDH